MTAKTKGGGGGGGARKSGLFTKEVKRHEASDGVLDHRSQERHDVPVMSRARFPGATLFDSVPLHLATTPHVHNATRRFAFHARDFLRLHHLTCRGSASCCTPPRCLRSGKRQCKRRRSAEHKNTNFGTRRPSYANERGFFFCNIPEHADGECRGPAPI